MFTRLLNLPHNINYLLRKTSADIVDYLCIMGDNPQTKKIVTLFLSFQKRYIVHVWE